MCMTALLWSAGIELSTIFTFLLLTHLTRTVSPKTGLRGYYVCVLCGFVASLTLPKKGQTTNYMWPSRTSAFVQSTHVDIHGVWRRFLALGTGFCKMCAYCGAAHDYGYINFAHYRSFTSSSLHLQGVFSKTGLWKYHVLRQPPVSLYCVSKRQPRGHMVFSLSKMTHSEI